MGDKSRYKHWYAYLYGHPLCTENYQLIKSKPWCSSGRSLCAIYADGYEDQPFEFTDKLKRQIATAIATGSSQPQDSDSPVVILKS